MWRQPRDDGRTVAINWCSGVSLCYLLYMTLYLPLAEANMSYRHLAPLRQFVAANVHSPVMSHGLGEPQRAMFDYYCDLTTTRLEVHPQASEDWFLTQTDYRLPRDRELKGLPWKLVWEDVPQPEGTLPPFTIVNRCRNLSAQPLSPVKSPARHPLPAEARIHAPGSQSLLPCLQREQRSLSKRIRRVSAVCRAVGEALRIDCGQ